jgi:hypothetical protein
VVTPVKTEVRRPENGSDELDFGKVTSQINLPRDIQIAAKIVF